MSLVRGVIKRSGATAPFDADRIRSAIARAGTAAGGLDSDAVTRATGAVLAKLADEGAGYPHVEHIQDVVEAALIEQGHTQVARLYISYRDQHARLR